MRPLLIAQNVPAKARAVSTTCKVLFMGENLPSAWKRSRSIGLNGVFASL